MDKVVGGIEGLLIGDALGVPYEFHSPEQIPAPDDIDFEPPYGFRPAHEGVPPGTWSDDGAQALCLLESLLHCGRLDVADFGQRLVDWFRKGHLAVDGAVFDVGTTTAEALRRVLIGVDAACAGPTDENSNGNGALMRVLPLAIWHQGTDQVLFDEAAAQSRVTHGHLRSQICCGLYCMWVRGILSGEDEPWLRSVATVRRVLHHDPAALEELEHQVRHDVRPGGRGSGYVVDTLHSARGACEAGSYPEVVKAAIRLGHDTDTTACIAGGVAGVRGGVKAIPEPWRQRLRGRDLCDPLIEGLVHHRS